MTQETSEKMSVTDEQKMSSPSEKMSEPVPEKAQKMSEASGTEPEKMSVVLEGVPEKMSEEPYAGPLNINDMETYYLQLKDGREVPVMAEPKEFDAALIAIGYNLIDRATWPIYHRLLVLEQAPRGKGGIRLVRRPKNVVKNVGDSDGGRQQSA